MLDEDNADIIKYLIAMEHKHGIRFKLLHRAEELEDVSDGKMSITDKIEFLKMLETLERSLVDKVNSGYQQKEYDYTISKNKKTEKDLKMYYDEKSKLELELEKNEEAFHELNERLIHLANLSSKHNNEVDYTTELGKTKEEYARLSAMQKTITEQIRINSKLITRVSLDLINFNISQMEARSTPKLRNWVTGNYDSLEDYIKNECDDYKIIAYNLRRLVNKN